MEWTTETVLHMPPAPDKEMPFAVVNLFHFPTEEVAKAFEENIRSWWPELMFFVGRVTGDVSERFTHCIVWLYKDFDEHRRNFEGYLEQLAREDGREWPGYEFDDLYCCRVVDTRDPLLVEHGIEGWTERFHASANPREQFAESDRVRASLEKVGTKFMNVCGEAIVRSGYLPGPGSDGAPKE